MTHDELIELDIVPRWLGNPWYPGGMPLRREQITWIDDETLEDKYRRYLKLVIDNKPPDPEIERLLKNWVIYYLWSPMWRWNAEAFEHTVQPLLQKNLLSMSLSQLIDECLDIGIDPL